MKRIPQPKEANPPESGPPPGAGRGADARRSRFALGALRHASELLRRSRERHRPIDYEISLYFRERSDLGEAERGSVVTALYGAMRGEIYYRAVVDEAVRRRLFPADRADRGVALLWALAESGHPPRELLRAYLDAERSGASAFAELAGFFAENRRLAFLEPDETLRFSTLHAFPQWVTEALDRTLGRAEIARLFDGLNAAPPLAIRANRLKTTRDDLRARLAAEGVEAEPGALAPDALRLRNAGNVFRLPSFREGLFEVQDEGSQLVSLLVAPKPSSRVLDACAGSGGKTLHLGALMRGRGELFASDTDARRLSRMTARVRRSGLQNVRVLDTEERLERFRERHAGTLDRILVDAPCSGLGTVRRNPDIKRNATPELVDAMRRKQTEILDQFAPFLRPGGQLVYVTCSILPSENEAIVERFLAEHADFRLRPVGEVLAQPAPDGASAPLAERFAGESVLRLTPHADGTDGFYGAVLERTR